MCCTMCYKSDVFCTLCGMLNPALPCIACHEVLSTLLLNMLRIPLLGNSLQIKTRT